MTIDTDTWEVLENIRTNVLMYLTSKGFIISALIAVLVVLLCIALSKAFKVFKKNFEKRNEDRDTSKSLTIMHVVSSIIKGVIILVGVIVILQVNGVKVSALITSVSIMSAIIGLALQDMIRNVVQGIHIVTDNYFMMGDVIHYNGVDGEVISITLHATKIRDIRTDNILTISNRNISEVTKASGRHDINVMLSYDEDYKKVYEVLKSACAKIDKLEEIESCSFLGTQDFESSAIAYRLVLFTAPKEIPAMHRAAIGIIQKELKEAGIEIPYEQLDVHVKENENS